MSDVTAIAVAPLIDAVAPYIVAALGAAVTGFIGLAATAFTRWTGVKIDAAYLALVKAAAVNEAQKALANADASFATAQINVGSPIVKDAVSAILGSGDRNLTAALAATGATPGLVASFVAGAIGELQAKILSVSPAPTVAPAPVAVAPKPVAVAA